MRCRRRSPRRLLVCGACGTPHDASSLHREAPLLDHTTLPTLVRGCLACGHRGALTTYRPIWSQP